MGNSTGRPTDVSPLRRVAAAVTLGGTAVGLAVSGVLEQDFRDLRWGLVGLAAVTGVASVALLRRTVLAQVMARGLSWLLFLPVAAGVLESLLDGRLPPAWPTALLASVGASLLLARPHLSSPEASREFAPVAYRRTFMAGAIAAATVGLAAGAGWMGDLLFGGRDAIGLGVLSAAMLASTLGVVRMRSWGVLLGVVTSLAMAVEAMLHANDFTGVGYALAALPGVLLAAPLLAARLRTEPDIGRAQVTRTRMPEATDALVAGPVRVRISEFPPEDAGEPAAPRRLTARAD
jgi:hypothetical protein